MSFTGNFTVSQQSPTSNSVLLFTDTSTGSDPNLTDRRIYPYKADGTLLLPTGNTLGYIDWPIGVGSTLSVDFLPRDFALTITVVWISSLPIGGSTYSVTTLYGFTGYSDSFIYQIIENLSANPSLRQNVNYMATLNRAETDVDNVVRSVANFSILNAQENLDDMQYIITNQNQLFA